MSRTGQTIAVAIGNPTAELKSRSPEQVYAVPRARPGVRTQTPPIDIHEGPDGLVLEADLPGVGDQGVNIQLEDNVLELTAEVPGELGPEIRVLHQEYAVPGLFHRSFILSDEVDRAGITAELKNGVLRLHLPRAERLKSRKIEVKGS